MPPQDKHRVVKRITNGPHAGRWTYEERNGKKGQGGAKLRDSDLYYEVRVIPTGGHAGSYTFDTWDNQNRKIEHHVVFPNAHAAERRVKRLAEGRESMFRP